MKRTLINFFSGLFFLFISTAGYSQCPVVADFDFQRMCNAGMIDFADQSFLVDTGLIVGWYWDFSDGNNSIAQNPNHNFIPGFTYNVQLTVTDSSGCTDTVTIPVFVEPLPVASFTFNPNNVCSGSSISFSSTSTGVGLTYHWDFGDGTTSGQQNPSHVFTSYGCGVQNFTVTLTVTDTFGCVSTVSHTVTILQQPEVLFVENNGFTFCHTDTTNISDTAVVYNFSPDAGCITSYTVDWGDGSPPQNISLPFDATNPVQHIYTSLGYFSVTFTAVGSNGCITTDVQTVTIESNPVAVLIGPPMGTNSGCAPMQICVTNISQNISSTTNLLLNWGDGITQILPPSSVGDTVCHIYHLSGCNNGVMTNYSITLTASNVCDFSSVSWSPVRIYSPPEAEFTIVDDSVCVDEPVVFINITEPNSCAASSFTTYTWDFGDGTTFGPTPVHWSSNPQQTVTHTYGDTGTYTVTLIATNNSTNGCGSSQYSMTVYVSDAFAEFAWDTVCYGDPTSFIDQSWAPGATIVGWEWSFGDGGTSTQQNPTHTYNTWGDFNACLAITTNLGCTDTICHVIHVDTLPFVDFAYDTVCFGDTTHFTNLSYGYSTTIVSNQWYFGDGNSSTEVNPSHLYGASGNYTVTLIVIDSNGCTDTIQHIVPVSPPPVADFTADTACFGYPSGFISTATTSFGTIVSWEWDFGDGIGTATGPNASYTYGDTGVYYVTHIVFTDIGCVDTIVLPVYVSPNPVANFTADTVCAGNITTFTDLSDGNGTTISSWQWNFGDGNSSTVQNPTHTYSQGGTYNVSLIVTNQYNCSDTLILPVVVDSIPLADFSYIPACLGYAVPFTDESVSFGSPIVSWEWNFGDGNTASAQNPTHTYGSSGTFMVTLVVTNSGGCTDTVSIPITVYEPPLADFTWNGSCLGFATNFTDSSTSGSGIISGWSWDFGDGIGNSTLQNPSYIYSGSGLYTVTLIVSDNNGCSDTIVQSIYVGPLPTADFSNTSACAGDSVFFTDLSSGNGHTITSWTWDFGDGNSSNQQHPSHQFSGSGTYFVQLVIVNNLGCTDTVVHIVIADSLPSAQFSSTTVCLGDSTVFSDLSLPNGGTINSWLWNFGDGTTDSQQNPAHLYSTDGSYNVTLVVQNTAGCIDSITIPVLVRPLPDADFIWASACVNQQVNFQDSSSGGGGINSWHWDFGDGIGTSAIQNPHYTYNVIDTFDVTLVVTDLYGCSNFITIPVTVETVPTAQFIADSVCFGDFTSFTDLSNGNGSIITTWSWDFGDGNTSVLQNDQNQYPASGNYSVELIVSNLGNCADTSIATVFVRPSPQASFSSVNVCDGNSMFFNDLSLHNSLNIQSWLWDLGDGTSTGVQNPDHIYSGPGVYGVELIVENDWGCFDTLLQSVEVYALPVPDFTAGVACLGFTTSFQDLSIPQGSPIGSWIWDFGDGIGTSTQQNPDWTYTTGTPPYSVTLIIEDGNGCVDSISHSIDLHPQPVADFNATTACSLTPTQFNDLSVPAFGTIQSWNWDFGDGSGSSNQQNPSYTYAPVGSVTTFNVTLIATDSNGCPDTIVQTVTVNPQPLADFLTDTVCSGDATSFTDLSSAMTGTIQTWSWDFGDGTGSSSLQNPVYTYGAVTSVTSYSSSLIITDSNGCSDTIVQDVLINPLPIPNFTASTICTGIETDFTDLSTSNGGSISFWGWDFGDGIGNSVNQNPAYLYDTVFNPTTFFVTLTVGDVNGCMKDTIIPVLVNPLPVADFSTNATCSGFPSSFIDLSGSTGGNINTWSWDFGDGSGTSSQQNPNYSYATTSTIDIYDVTLIVTDVNGCADTVIHQATVIPSPSGDFVSDSVCSGITSQFQDLSSTLGGTLVSWNWDFGDGSGSSNIQNPNYLYGGVPVTTTYQVQLIVENSFGCLDTIEQVAVVYPLPVPDFSTDTVCMGNVTNFWDQSSSAGGNLSAWSWDFGDGTGTSTLQNPQYTYTNHGFYQVELSVTDVNLCQESVIQTVFVDSLPLPSFTWTPSCAPGIINFNNTSNGNGSTIVSYFWDFDDGFMGGLQNPVHYYSSNGNYDVSLTVHNDRGCSNTIVVPVSVNPGLEVDFSASNVCFGEDVYFSHFLINPNMPIQTWLWSFGDGTFSTDPDPVHLYNQPGTYNVLLTVTDSLGCDFTVTHQVTVYVNPVADFNATTVQVGNPTSFTDLSFSANGFISSWQWDFGDGGTSVQQNPLHTYGNAGTYMVTLIVFNNFGCSDTITLPVIVNAIVNADFIADTVCSGSPTTFTDLSVTGIGTIASWYWDFGDGYASVQQNPQHVYISDGVYSVTLIVTADFGISDTVSYQIQVLESPVADFTFTEVCFGNPTGLFDQSSGNNYPVSGWQWQTGDGNSSLQPTVHHYYQSDGQWQVQLIVTNTIGCTDTIIKLVNVWQIPQVEFDADPREGCLPLNVHFSDLTVVSDGVIVSWLWDFGDGFIGVSAGGAIHNYPYPGVFDISLTVVSNHGCENTLTVPNMIQVWPSPIASFIYQPSTPTIAEGIVFTDMSLGASQWWWDFGDNTSTQEQSPMHHYFYPGSYDVVQVVFNDFGCADTTSVRIRLNTDEMIWFPNVISVNDDGQNDVFHVYGSGWQSENFEMRIFSRWGKEIFYTTDINKGWNGTDSNTGEKVQVGVYVWKIRVMDFSNNIVDYMGIVTVIE